MKAHSARLAALSALIFALMAGALDVHAAALAHSSMPGATRISVDATHANEPAHFETSELATHEPCCGCFSRHQGGSLSDAARHASWAPPRELTPDGRARGPASELGRPGRPRAPPVA